MVRVTATYPARAARAYRGVIYGYDILDHETDVVVPNDYRGKTRQRGKLRELQHRERQQFADRIVGSANVLWEGICTDEELAEMERRFIQDAEVRPRLNVEMNEDNPHRIPKWKQIEQRHERDRAAGRPLWVPYEQRTRESLLEWDTPDRPAYERASPVRQRRSELKPWQKRTIGWGSAWLVSTLVLWLLDLLRWHLGGWVRTLVTAALAVAMVLAFLYRWSSLGFPMTGKSWSRAARQAKRRSRR